MTKVGLPGAEQGWQETDVTMATILKSQGYSTGQFGKNHQGDRKPEMTDEQFYYKTRKYAIGPFKKDIFTMDGAVVSRLEDLWGKKFSDLFNALNIKNTKTLVEKIIPEVTASVSLEDYLGTSGSEEDVSDLAD